MADRPNIHQQIEELRRELALRRSVYPGWVSRGKLRQSEADEHMARMEVALATLEWCRDHRDTIATVEKAAHPMVALGPDAPAVTQAPVILSISLAPGARLSAESRDALLRMAEAAAEALRALPGAEA